MQIYYKSSTQYSTQVHSVFGRIQLQYHSPLLLIIYCWWQRLSNCTEWPMIKIDKFKVINKSPAFRSGRMSEERSPKSVGQSISDRHRDSLVVFQPRHFPQSQFICQSQTAVRSGRKKHLLFGQSLTKWVGPPVPFDKWFVISVLT